LTKAYLASKNIAVLDWPACSPDLNPIENLWGLLVRDIYANNKQYTKVDELKQAICRAWNRLQPNQLKTLVDSMPNRLFEIALNQGGSTHY